MGDENTAAAIETDFLRYFRVDLLDLYRGRLSFRRVCALVAHLPEDAAVFRNAGPDGGWTRTDYLLAALERRVTALWATVAVAFGHTLTDEQLASPLKALTSPPSQSGTARGEPEVMSLREIALMMRGT